MSAVIERQALVPDADGAPRHRWTVLLRLGTVVRGEEQRVEHHSDQVDPTLAIRDAIRAAVDYADGWIPAVRGLAYRTPAGELRHPSVEGGWMRARVITVAGVELPGDVLVRLQGYGGARDTQLETVTL